MARPKSWQMIAAAVVVAVVIGAVAIALSPGDDGPSAADGDQPTTVSEESTPSVDGADVAAPGAVVSADAEEILPPGSNSGPGSTGTTPKPPAESAPAPGSDDPDADRDRYLHDTREAVETNAEDIKSVAQAVVTAYSGGDEAKLASLILVDEGDQGGYVDELAAKYPPILESVPAAKVNVYSNGATTIYVIFCNVTWEDAGLISRHTIAIPLRLVDGRWYLTSYFENASALEFVQSVSL